MKIRKTLFETSIEIEPSELRTLRDEVPSHMSVGLLFWLKKSFGLDMLPKPTPMTTKEKGEV